MKYIVSQFNAAEIANCTTGQLSAGSPDVSFPGISIDTRTLRQDELFFAIRGPRLDGHKFIPDALAAGAGGVVAESASISPETIPSRKVLIKVQDTHQALKDLACSVRQSWQGTVVGLTGSMGKTTTKEFAAQILEHACSVYRTPGNYNNLYGLPLAIFGLEPENRVGIFEMGMSEPGEIAAMCRIAAPRIGVITNVAPVHLEFFRSLRDIADAKAELAEALPADGILLYNGDNALVRNIAAQFEGRKISFGFEEGADFQADRIEIVNLHQTRFRLRYKDCNTIATIPMAGAHFIMNALPGIALGQLYGLQPEQLIPALSDLKAASMRGRILNFSEGFTVIDDSYNSNPEALKGMIEMLSGVPGFKRRILVAGEMLELGPSSKSLHYECGLFASNKKLDVVIGVRGDAREITQGSLQSGMSEAHARYFSKATEASDFLKNEVREGDIVLVKGSRGVRMEAVIKNLRSVFECEI